MILMRMAGIQGDCRIEGYEKWITVENIGFGVSRSIERKSNAKDVVVKKSEPQEVTVSKSVDSATVDLMFKAIKDRTPQDNSTPVAVDIHLVQPQMENHGGDADIKPYLKIKLGTVLISDWSLDADSEGRPTESLTLHFNQVAMEYHTSEDGKIYQRYGPRGWDPAKNGEWKPPEWDKEWLDTSRQNSQVRSDQRIAKERQR